MRGDCLALLMGHQRKPRFPMLRSVSLTRTRWPSSRPQGFSSIGDLYSWVPAEGQQHPDLPLSPHVLTTIYRLYQMSSVKAVISREQRYPKSLLSLLWRALPLEEQIWFGSSLLWVGVAGQSQAQRLRATPEWKPQGVWGRQS